MQPAASVDTRAKRFSFGHNLLKCALVGAANERRAGEYCQAAFGGRLVYCANTHLAAHRDGWSVWVALNQRDHAIRQHMPRGGLDRRRIAIVRSHTLSFGSNVRTFERSSV